MFLMIEIPICQCSFPNTHEYELFGSHFVHTRFKPSFEYHSFLDQVFVQMQLCFNALVSKEARSNTSRSF